VPHISFSALKKWKFCPFYHKLIYIDKLKGFEGNAFTAFGSAIHTVCEKLILNEVKDLETYFHESFVEELGNLKEELIDWDLVEKMRTQGHNLVKYILPAVKEQFPDGFEVVSVEEQLIVPIEEFQDTSFDFKGYIDLVLKTNDGNYHIIDWKSCSWGWDSRRKTDPMNVYQLTFYKKFWAKKHKIDPKNIVTYFALLKRTAKKNKVEFVKVTSGNKRMQNAVDFMTRALFNIDAGNHIKNRLSCSKCEFRRTKHCP
tara:strand:- start:795 stop:1565 length:771 start_codon:yes stop_codon:yes gene_type:complete